MSVTSRSITDETCPSCKKCKMIFVDRKKEFYCPKCGCSVGAFYFRKSSIESASLQSLDGPATRGGERNGADEAHPAGRLQGASPHSSKEDSL